MNHDIGYREEDGVVVLRMTRDDYEGLLVALGFALGASGPASALRVQILGLVNRLNAGNPNFTPYEEAAGADPR